ncbi:MAG: SRPBCC domain-containing protein [Bacteroidota bacterium]|nr:SRPBCC domain-containing protein [Bacteroidota bacterium]
MKSFTQEIIINATPERVYNALVNPVEHSDFTGGHAENTDSMDEDFSIYDGYINGKNLNLVPGKCIHQTWQAAEEGWPEDHYSEVKYELEIDPHGTLIKFTHNNVPDEYADDIYNGWKEHYWEPLQAYFINE